MEGEYFPCNEVCPKGIFVQTASYNELLAYTCILKRMILCVMSIFAHVLSVGPQGSICSPKRPLKKGGGNPLLS